MTTLDAGAPPATATSTLDLSGVSRWYGNVVAVNDVTMRLGPGVTGPARPEWRRQDHPAAHDGRLPRPVPGHGRLGRHADLAQPRRLPAARPGQRAGGGAHLPHRVRVRAGQREAAPAARPGGGGAPGHRAGGDGGRAGPADRHVLQGDAPAHPGGRGAGARPAGAAARRAVQRDGPAAAAAHDGAAALPRRRRPDHPVQLAHPGGGRAGLRHRAGDGGRPAGRVRRLSGPSAG